MTPSSQVLEPPGNSVRFNQEFGPDFRGDELPGELALREKRLKVIRDAKKRLEDRKAQEAREEDERKARRAKEEGREPPKERPELRKHPKGEPKPKDQENFTDPDSRIMKDGSGAFQQSYNAHIAVDESEHIIVGALVTNTAADVGELMPLIDAAETAAATRTRPTAWATSRRRSTPRACATSS